MLGIWFNHDDRVFRTKKHEDFECLKQFGFTDAFLCIKGGMLDMRDTPERHAHLDLLFREIHNQGIRTHGLFICSEDQSYLSQNPDRGDTTVLARKSDVRISHVDQRYLEHLTRSILSAVREYQLEGIQFDFLRYGFIGNGWSPEEKNIYNTFGVNAKELEEMIRTKYDPSKPHYNLESIFSLYWEGDEQVHRLSAARRSIIRNFLNTLSGNIRTVCPCIELSAAMMPEGLYPPKYDFAELHYGQWYEDFYPCVDHLYPMIYSNVYGQNSIWTGELGKRVEESFPGSVIGLEAIEPMTSNLLQEDIFAIRGQKHEGINFFRYGRMILAMREGQNTMLYNTYPGTVSRLILCREGKELEMDCEIEEASWSRISGQWDLVRPFGRFRISKDRYYEGELCVLDRRFL